MICYFCGNKESKYVCSDHARNMFDNIELKKLCNGSCDVKYYNENEEPLYHIEDIRKSYQSLELCNNKADQDTKDNYFRRKNIIETYYQKKIIKEKRKSAIENFTYVALKKLDMTYIPKYQKDVSKLITHMCDDKTLTPAECAIKIYKTYEEEINFIIAKKFRIELALNFLSVQSNNVQKHFINSSNYYNLINGNITYDDFVSNITKYSIGLEKQQILNDYIKTNIPREYISLCCNADISKKYLKNENIDFNDVIRCLELMVQKQKSLKIINIYKTNDFFNTF
jgi:hypothetical protein